MIIYVVAAAAGAILAVFLGVTRSSRVNVHNPVSYVPILPLLGVAVLRTGVGKDTVGVWSTYPLTFELASKGYDYSAASRLVSVEPGYFWINQVAVALHLDVSWIYVLMSVIFLGLIYRFILEYSENIPLSIIILVASDLYLFALSGIRQGAATAIVFYALRFAERRKFLPFVALIVMASLLHFVSIFFVLAYFFVKRRATATVVGLLLGLGALLGLLPSIARSIIGIFYGSAYFGSKWDYSNFNLVPTLICGVIVLFALSRQTAIVSAHPAMQIHVNLMLFNLFLMLISATLITPIRLYFFLIPSSFVLIPAIANAARDRSGFTKMGVSLLLTLVISGQLVYELVSGNDAYGTWQYQSIFMVNF